MPNNNVLIIDGDVLAFQVTAATETVIDWGDGVWTKHNQEADVIELTRKLIKKWLLKTGCKEYIVCLSGSNNFRKELYPEYKANRVGKEKPILYKFCIEYLYESHNAVSKINIEADDLIGIISTNPDDPIDYVNATIDKDLKTLPNTYYYDINKNTLEWITEEEADRLFYIQTLTGDAVDNYPGCKGFGPKTAATVVDKAMKEGEDLWLSVLQAYEKKGFGSEFALTQARLARILRASDWDADKEEVKLWTP